MPFIDFLNRHGIMYKVERNGKFVDTVRGLPNSDEMQKEYIGLMPNTDVHAGDWMINPQNERFYIEKTKTEYAFSKPHFIAAYCIMESDYQKQKQSRQSAVFNIGEVHNSVVGTQKNATVNNGYSINDLNALIEQHDSLDKELLKDMISVLETAISNQEPMKKGFLSKFAGVMQRNEWISAPVATFILEHFLHQ